MSYVFEAVGKVHERQLAAATKSQDFVIKIVEKLADLREKAPKAPEALQGVTEPLQKVTEPLHKVLGDRGELASYVASSTRDWFNVQQQFRSQLLDVIAGPGSAPATKASTRKTTAQKA